MLRKNAVPLAAVVLTAVIFVLDLQTPLGIADGILYLLPLLLTVRMPQRYMPFHLATVFTGLILLGSLFSPPGATLGTWGTNRAISIVGVWATAAFLVQRKRVEDALCLGQAELEGRVIEGTAALQKAIHSLEKDITERKRVEAELQESHALLQAVIEGSTDAIFVKDLRGRYLMINSAGVCAIGKTKAEIIGKDDTELFPPETARRLMEWDQHIMKTEETETREEIVTVSGITRTYLTMKGPSRDQDGCIIGLIGIARDITERKRAEESLARLAAIVESSDDAIIGKSLDGIVLSWNKGAEHLFGYTAQDVIGKPITLLIPHDRIDEETGIIERIKRGERIEHFETVRRRKDGQEIHVSLSLSSIKNAAGEIIGLSEIARDITERKQVHEALNMAYTRLVELTIRLDAAQEEERKHISREIHDELGQSLTALKLDFAWLNKRLTAMADSDTRSHLLEKVRAMSSLLDSTKQTVRKIATSLRPRVLDNLGLAVALKAQASEFQDHAGVRCDVAIDPRVMELQIDSASSTAIFRIAQELLTNVMRHAQASEVRISLTEEAGGLVLEVRDDGRGITEPEIATTASIGLVGIRERASRLGGEFTIRGKPEKGTVAIVRIPIAHPPC